MNRLRLWPAYLILALVLLANIVIWTRDTGHRQFAVMLSLLTGILGVIFLILWAFTFSRLPNSIKLRIAAGGAVLIILASASVRIHGVTGDLVPILSWRWSDTEYGVISTTEEETGVYLRDYPQFLGPARNASIASPELADWTDHPPEERWRITVGEGWSTFAVKGTTAITQEQRNDKECVVAYDILTGSQQWVHETDARYETTIGGVGPRATPTITGNRVYTLGATGYLTCLDFETGRSLWSRNILEENGGRIPDWGLAGSPLILDGMVVVSAGGRDGRSLVAYDAESGSPLWHGGSGRAGYSSPSLHRIAGRDQILIFNNGSVAGHDPETGEVLWTEPWFMPGGNQCVSQPLPIGDNRVFVSTGYGVGCKLYELTDKGEGVDVAEIYATPRMKAKFTQVVKHDGYLYGLDDGVLVCLDPATGQRKWKRGRYGHGQILLVGNKLIVQTEDGEVILVRPNPEKLVELGTIPALDSKTWNNPVLAGSLLLVRNNREAVCYEVKLETELSAIDRP